MEKYKELENLIDPIRIKYNVSMKDYTTVCVGGNCDCLVTPTNIEELQKVLGFAKSNNIEYYIIGNGSNLLVVDEDVHVLIIKLASKFSEYKIEDETIECLAGLSMPKVSLIAKQNSLEGFEFACGIPGTVGGGVKMNAGAYGSEFVNVVEEVKYINDEGEIVTVKNEDLNYSYRHSIFTEHPTYVVVSAKFKLKKGNVEEIDAKMKENSRLRKEKQPLEYPNFGSVFKRPKGYFVGKLIIESGLQGYQIGGAQVSTKHAGFIVNVDNATCKDILDLIEHIKGVVHEKFGVMLETEVQFIGGKK